MNLDLFEISVPSENKFLKMKVCNESSNINSLKINLQLYDGNTLIDRNLSNFNSLRREF